jgi:flagellar biosynthesis component FlhA
MKEDLDAKEKELNKRITIGGILMIIGIIILPFPFPLVYLGIFGVFLSLILILVGFSISSKAAIELVKIKAEKFKNWWKK